MITIQTVGIIDAQKQIAALTPEFQKKARKAIRATMKDAKSKAVEAVLERYTIQKADVSKTLRTKISGLQGELTASGKNNLLYKFRNTPQGRIKSRGVYIKSEVVRGATKTNKLAWRKSRGPYIFERKGSKRLPYKKVYGPSTPRMLANHLVSQKVVKFMENKFVENFV